MPAQRPGRVDPERSARFNELSGAVELAAAEMRELRAAVATAPESDALAAYLGALGWNVSAERLGPWLMLLSVAFFELGAGLSLTVARALSERPVEAPRLAVSVPAVAEVPQVLPAVLEAPNPVYEAPTQRLGAVAERIRQNGGKVEGSLNVVSRILGVGSKTAAHRALRGLAAAGVIALTTSQNGIVATALR